MRPKGGYVQKDDFQIGDVSLFNFDFILTAGRSLRYSNRERMLS